MAVNNSSNGVTVIAKETKKLKRELTLLPLFGLMYFTVSGGSYGIEPLIGWSGPGLAMLLIILTPIVFSLPNVLMVRELTSMMPAEGGYYHWVKQAFGPFVGFMAGWNNWMMSLLDVPIYTVLAAYYLGYFLPPLREGMTVGGIELSANFLSWLVSALLIWVISYMQIRGARLSGLFTGYLTIIVIGFSIWIAYGVAISNLALIVSNCVAFVVGTVTIVVALHFRSAARAHLREPDSL